MQILPVLDLKSGLVVRGVMGQRHAYRPVESRIAADAWPATVARAFRERLGLAEAYVADLDAIAGGPPAWDIYRELADCGLRLWVDAGAGTAARAAELAAFEHAGIPLGRIVVGLESLADEAALAETARAVGPERLAFSLDLKAGRPLSDSPAWKEKTPSQIAAVAVAAGVRTMIVLDLARVGTGAGVGTESLCRNLRASYPTLELVAGGGVRDLSDLQSLSAAGCRWALVASALHDQRIGPTEIARVQAPNPKSQIPSPKP